MVGVESGIVDQSTGWADTAPHVEHIDVDISFLLRDSFSTSTKGNARDWPTKPLRLPSFPRAEPLVASFRDVEGHVPELAAYYRDAFAALQSNNASASTLYWLRLVLSGGKPGTDIGFGWWDTLGEMRPFFRWIDEAADGQIFDDLDQGWRVQALRCGSELCFRHTDFDSEEELGRVRAPREACIAAADDAWARTQRIVEQLHRELGINPWA